jgi:hypothetical protein
VSRVAGKTSQRLALARHGGSREGAAQDSALPRPLPPGSDSAYYDFAYYDFMGSYTDGAQYDFKEIIFYRQILALVHRS